jgi:hypothetical protein
MRIGARLGAARVPVAVGLLKYHRMARKVTTRNTRTCGMLIDCSAMVACCVFVVVVVVEGARETSF